jgi:hypothetical protein
VAAATTAEAGPSNGRSVPANIPQPAAAFAKQSSVMRKIAATDFICDPDGHSIRWHYERKDRLYEKTIAWRTFEGWSLKDTWTARREAYWEHIESRIRDHMADEILRRRLKDLENFENKLTALDRFLEPLLDDKGEIQTDDDGLPKYALKLPDMDKFIAMYLKLHERVMLLRGEATTRSEQLRPAEGAAEGEGPLNEHLRGRSTIAPKLSRQDARAMARAMLTGREPALGGGPEADTGVIDATPEGPENGDHGSDQRENVSEGQAVGGDEGGSG